MPVPGGVGQWGEDAVCGTCSPPIPMIGRNGEQVKEKNRRIGDRVQTVNAIDCQRRRVRGPGKAHAGGMRYIEIAASGSASSLRIRGP